MVPPAPQSRRSRYVPQRPSRLDVTARLTVPALILFAVSLTALARPATTAGHEARSRASSRGLLEAAQAYDEGRHAAQSAGFEAASAQEAALSRAMAINREQYGRVLSALQLYSRNPPPALVVSPSSANDAVRAAILMRAIAPELARRARVMDLQSQDYAAARRRLVLANVAVLATESQMAERRFEMARLDHGPKLGRLRGESGAELPAEGARLQGLVGTLASGRSAPRGGAPFPGRLVSPAPGAPAARFGAPGPAGAHSPGLTFHPAPGAVVRAPAPARVVFAGPLKGWGQVVVLDLGGEWRVVLAGLGRLGVVQGRSVAAGESLGASGGARDGAGALYMELRQGETPVDPGARLDGG